MLDHERMLPQSRVAITIDDLYSRKLEAEDYGWGTTARTLCERHIADTYASTEKPFVLVDLCSAYPIFAQILRERRREDRFNLAKKIVGQFSNDVDAKPEDLSAGLELPSTEKLSKDEKRSIRNMVSPKNGDVRSLLRAIVTDLLYSPPHFKHQMSTIEKVEVIRDRISYEMDNRKDHYDRISELPELAHHGGNWSLIVPRRVTKSVRERIAAVTGSEKAEDLLTDFSKNLSARLIPFIEIYEVLTLDLKAPKFIRAGAERSFPDVFKSTKFFRKAGFLDGSHLRANLMAWSFGDERVNVFTCIEGWPFYFGLEEEACVDIAVNIAKSLKPGGKAVIFPWILSGDYVPHDKDILARIEELWDSEGLVVKKEEWQKKELEANMTDRELVLLINSPVFKSGDETLTSLILEKPAT